MADLKQDLENPDWSDFEPQDMTLSTKLRSIRARLGMSQDTFSKLLHIPRSTLQNWEQGRTVPDRFARAMIDLIYDEPEGMIDRLRRQRVA